MAQPNVITVPKYIPPEDDKKTGYSNDTNRQGIEESYLRVQTMVDFDSDNFKYGLEDYSSQGYVDPKYFFQDPLFPVFDIILDDIDSPLLITQNGLASFLDDYSAIYSMRARQKIHTEFIKTLYTLFNSTFRNLSTVPYIVNGVNSGYTIAVDRNKAYYINSIAGLDKLTSRIVDFEKDKITITLNEDVSMIAGYLAQLYNNLSYSYRDQKQMIPANLLRFNMYIKANDVRNMVWYTYVTDQQTGKVTTVPHFEKSYIIYKLRDCTFDFKKSKNFEDTVTWAGFDAAAPTTPAKVSFDVVYKSIEIESEFPLIIDSFKNTKSSTLKLNNKDKDILAYPDMAGLNGVYQNNTKVPSEFGDGLASNAKLNNDQSLTPIGKDKNARNKAAEDNYKFGVTSSDIGTTKTREKDITDFKKAWDTEVKSSKSNPPTWTSISSTKLAEDKRTRNKVMATDGLNTTTESKYDPDVQSFSTTSGGTAIGPYWRSDSKSNKIHEDNENVLNNINFSVNDLNQGDLVFPGDLSVKVQQMRDSMLGQLNGLNALFSLPFNIISMFMGGMHGLNGLFPLYISENMDYYGPRGPSGGFNPNLYTLNGEMIDSLTLDPNGTLSHDEVLNGQRITFNTHTTQPLTAKIDTTTHPAQPLTAKIDNTPRPTQKISGKIDTTTHPAQPLTAKIDTTSHPRGPLSGNIDTTIKVEPPLSGYINTAFKPHGPVSGSIDTTVRPYLPILPSIDNTPRPWTPILGIIDQTSHPREPLTGSIDTTPRPWTPILGVIDTIARQRAPLTGSIDTTPRQVVPILGKIDTTAKQRVVDLGILYAGATANNLLPLIYLYTQTTNLKSLVNYHVYNNAATESKSLKNYHINQDVRTIVPLDNIYEYSNKVDIQKTLNNVILYNNEVNKNNNISVINVYNTITAKPEFNSIHLYDNISPVKEIPKIYLYGEGVAKKPIEVDYLYQPSDLQKTLNNQQLQATEKLPREVNMGKVDQTTRKIEPVVLGTIYEPSNIKKLLEPIYLFEPKSEPTIENLGRVYQIVADQERKNVLDTTIKPVVEQSATQKEIEKRYVSKQLTKERPVETKYISQEEIKEKQPLKGDTLSQDNKKEKEELNGERLR